MLKRGPSDEDGRSRKSHRRGADSPDRSRDGMTQNLPPLSYSLDLSHGKGILNFAKTPKKSTGGSSNKSVEKLPKASQNNTYTMEKFVSSRELAIFDVMASKELDVAALNDKEEEQDFERDSNNNEVDALMNQEEEPRMQSPIRFKQEDFVNYSHEPVPPTMSQSPRLLAHQVEP